MATRTYYRRNDDPKGWWHWRPKCKILQQRADSKAAGDEWTTMESETHPTTFALCPGCLAEDERIRTKSQAAFVKRERYPALTNVGETTDVTRRDEEPK